MNLSNFYVLVDHEKQIVIDKIQKLPENWCNISGLSGLSDDKLENLEWAQYPNLGWLSLTSSKIYQYNCNSENLELQKNTFKDVIVNLRKEKESLGIEYNQNIITLNNDTRFLFFILKEKAKENINFEVNYKFFNQYKTLSSRQILEIYDIIEKKIDEYYKWEMDIYEQIDKCTKISDFLNIIL